MTAFFKLFDSLTAKLPAQVAKIVRLAALLIWLIMGTLAALYAWSTGLRKAPQTGQDLSLSDIRERMQKEKNERSFAPVTIPDIGELAEEEKKLRMPFQSRERKSGGLSGEDNRLIEPDSMIKPGRDLPPFIGEESETMRKPFVSGSGMEPDNPYKKVEPMAEKMAKKKDAIPMMEGAKGRPGLLPED